MTHRIAYGIPDPATGSLMAESVSEVNPLPVAATSGVASTDNTSTTPLATGATFTGTWEKNGAPDVMVSCKTDNTGTLYFDFSNDGVNVDTFPVGGFSVSSGIHEFHTAVKGSRYFRVRFVNDAGTPTYMRLYTYFGQFRQGSAPVNQTLGLDSDASQVRPTDFDDEVVIGRRAGVTPWNKFGYRTGLTASGGDQTIWAAAGNYTPRTAASTFTIAYNSTNDGSGTTGALQLAIYYISDAGTEAVLLHTLGGTGTDVTLVSGFVINRVAVSLSSTNLTNANDITITATTGGAIEAILPAGQSVTQQLIFGVGSNSDGVAKMLMLHASRTASKQDADVLFKGWIFNREFSTKYEIFRITVDTGVEQSFLLIDPVGFKFSPSDVFYMTADTSADSVDVSARLSLHTYSRM